MEQRDSPTSSARGFLDQTTRTTAQLRPWPQDSVLVLFISPTKGQLRSNVRYWHHSIHNITGVLLTSMYAPHQNIEVNLNLKFCWMIVLTFLPASSMFSPQYQKILSHIYLKHVHYIPFLLIPWHPSLSKQRCINCKQQGIRATS